MTSRHTCETSDVTRRTCETRDVTRRTCDTSDVTRHTCETSDVTHHTCETRDVTRHTCETRDVTRHTCETRDFFPESPRRGICGRRLRNTVDALCRHYNKRSLTSSSVTSGNSTANALPTETDVNYFEHIRSIGLDLGLCPL